MEPTTLFAEFLKRINYPDPPAGEPGSQNVLSFDGNNITFTLEADAIRIVGQLGELEEADAERRTHLEKLLRLSLALAGEECICLDPESDQLLLTRRVPTIDQEPANFEEEVEAFLNRLDMWLDRERMLQKEKNQSFPGMFIR